jgi:hypothetical protein
LIRILAAACSTPEVLCGGAWDDLNGGEKA